MIYATVLGQYLIITFIDFTPARTIQNLLDAELTHLTLPKLEVSFSKLKSKLICRGKNIENLSIHDLEEEGVLSFTPPGEGERLILE